MSTLLTLFLVAVFTNESNLGTFILQKSSDVDEVKVVWNKEDSISLIIIIDGVPYLFSKETKSSSITVFEATYIRQSPQGDFNILLFTN